jgi:hypothetical protein
MLEAPDTREVVNRRKVDFWQVGLVPITSANRAQKWQAFPWVLHTALLAGNLGHWLAFPGL